MSPPAVIVNLQNAAECFEVKGRSLGLAVGGPITDEIAEFGWGIGRPFRWRPTTKKTSTRPDSVAGVRGLELRYPDTSHVFEMSMITVVGSAETHQQRLFAFELRRWGTRSSGLLPGSSRPMLCGVAYALEPLHGRT
jgi:hypothetical protein